MLENVRSTSVNVKSWTKVNLSNLKQPLIHFYWLHLSTDVIPIHLLHLYQIYATVERVFSWGILFYPKYLSVFKSNFILFAKIEEHIL